MYHTSHITHHTSHITHHTSLITHHTSQATFISSLVSQSLFHEGPGHAGVLWLIEDVKSEGGGGREGICGVDGALPALPVGWQNVSVMIYVEETLQVMCDV